jgi:hypothetical protein
MNEKITRMHKRKVEEENNFFFGLAKIQHHFFKGLPEWLKDVKDTRVQGYVTYGADLVLMTVLMKNAASVESMRAMDDAFNTDAAVRNICSLSGGSGLEVLPHHDTVNDFLEKVDPEDMDRIRMKMIKELLKGRSLEKYRIEDRYWGIAFDGTKLFHFKERHCEHCLKKSRNNPDTGEVTEWYEHYVLEAKLICGDMALSIGSEFIENEAEDVPKQDCEQKAFKRLAARLRKQFPKLPICVIADSLYCNGPVMDLCKEYGWQYLMRFKEGSIPTIAEEFQAIAKIGGLELNEDETVVFANGISYRQHMVNMMEKTDVNKKKEPCNFTFITSMTITKRKAENLAAAGRSRWMIENEGFNTQKNHRYYIEHACSLQYNAMKNHYLLTQIADIWVQLFENGIKAVREISCGIKRISSLLLESIRTRILTEEDKLQLGKAVQIRFT